ncbi:hypothetical protein U1Q18_016660 [Sarracenia purpurea var. burkii]
MLATVVCSWQIAVAIPEKVATVDGVAVFVLLGLLLPQPICLFSSVGWPQDPLAAFLVFAIFDCCGLCSFLRLWGAFHSILLSNRNGLGILAFLSDVAVFAEVLLAWCCSSSSGLMLQLPLVLWLQQLVGLA